MPTARRGGCEVEASAAVPHTHPFSTLSRKGLRSLQNEMMTSQSATANHRDAPPESLSPLRLTEALRRLEHQWRLESPSPTPRTRTSVLLFWERGLGFRKPPRNGPPSLSLSAGTYSVVLPEPRGSSLEPRGGGRGERVWIQRARSSVGLGVRVPAWKLESFRTSSSPRTGESARRGRASR